ncbi:MAG: PQQ-binding-like beta-propeller repeat protein [Acidobacteriota bacterium]
MTNCAITGNSLQKTAGRSDSADAGARSQQTVTSGDVFFDFTAGDSNKVLFCGLTHAAISTSFLEIDFAIKLTDFGVAEVRENNIYERETSYRAGDVFSVAVQANEVRYYKNGGLFYSSLKLPVYPLFADASFLTLGGKIDNAVIGALAVSSSADWKMYQHDAAHSGYSATSLVNSSNVGTLAQAWSFTTGGWVTGTPIVADGVVYIGSWDGNIYALRERDGTVVWSFNAGKLYFGTGRAQLIAVNAADGQLIWRSQLADPNQAFSHLWFTHGVRRKDIHRPGQSLC